MDSASAALALAIDDEDLRVAQLALSSDEFDECPRPESDGRFERIERLVARVSEKPQKLKPIVWPWTKSSIERSAVAGCFVYSLRKRPATRLIPYFQVFDPRARSSAISQLVDSEAWDQATREAIANLAGDAVAEHEDRLQHNQRPRRHRGGKGEAQGIEVLRDQRIVIMAGSRGRVDFLAWDNQTLIGSVTTSGRRLTSLHISPGGEFMALGDTDSSMSFWDLRVLQIPAMFSRPFAHARPLHLAAMQALETESSLSPKVGRAVAFAGCALRHRFRYDIEIDEVQSIRAGEFDITIE